MLFLLDANTLIDVNRDYYPIGRVDEYWSWLAYQGELGNVKIPVEVYEEITKGNDNLAKWAKDKDNKNFLRLVEDVDVNLVQKATYEGYATDLNDIEIVEIGRDPFLIAYALADPINRTIVTSEKSRPSARRKNRKVPDICNDLGIRSCNAFDFAKRLDFRTDWVRRPSS